jgi:EAL domain-containing protein (putative c-di-GMP-specific phosphodiesterase class I)
VSDDTTEITLTILAMAKQLGLKVIAEGVETREQAELLMDNGCDEFQGYLYGKPVTADEVGKMLHKSIKGEYVKNP